MFIYILLELNALGTQKAWLKRMATAERSPFLLQEK